ncbi:hypothetical protein [Caudoviricetes sp.]|nr:hypothetical protein [Caudoviricetes sp.]UOF81011.1 hypothetical protein [Caudoviricetes sp.]UOF81407.1 hypothetical protein [Caudoviricetes sp.]
MNEFLDEVNESVDLGDLSKVKQANVALPAASDVLFTITKAEIRRKLDRNKEPESAENPCALKKLVLTIRLDNGIEVNEVKEGGDMIMVTKFKGKSLFPELVIWANPDVKTSPWYVSKQHLLPIKQFLVALGYDPKALPTIDMTFASSLVGTKVKANILQKPVQVKDVETGKWVDTDEMKNEVTGWNLG